MHRILITLLVVPLLFSGCSQDSQSATTDPAKLKFGFITNGPSDFWLIAFAGIDKAKKEFDVTVKIIRPADNSDQKSAMEDMVSQGYAGIAISPMDPDNQTPFLDSVAAETVLITHDSDAPKSKRRCFIGVNNYTAGRMCGALVKLAIPDGGKVMLFIGQLSGDNARLRRQGVIDELFGRSEDPSRRDPNTELKSDDGKFIILGCLTDQMDVSAGKDNAEDTLTKHPDIACMVGLFEYNPPVILEALAGAGRLKTVKVVGFDENAATLQGIRDGTVAGTVVQNPYMYGYESVRVMAQIARGEDNVVPPGGIIEIPARKITRSNVDAFEKELKARLGN